MANITIKTQPTNATVAEYGTATFTVVLSGSAADPTSYLTSSKSWRTSGSWAEVGSALTLTLTNRQETNNGDKYYFTAHSASAEGTVVTSSMVTLYVVDKEVQFDGIDQAPNERASYSMLLGSEGSYRWYIPLLISGSQVDERYCPHFATKRDMREYINREVEVGTFTLFPTLNEVGASASVITYNTLNYAHTVNSRYDNLGYKFFIPLFYSGSQVDERYCPHFINKHDVKTFIDKEVEVSGFNPILGE